MLLVEVEITLVSYCKLLYISFVADFYFFSRNTLQIYIYIYIYMHGLREQGREDHFFDFLQRNNIIPSPP
jgi:hypothetical protein